MSTFKKVLLNIPRHRNIIDDDMPDGAVTAPAPPAAAAQTGDTGKDTGKGKGKGKRGGTKTKLLLLCPSITAVTDLTEPMQAALKEGSVVMIDHKLVRLR